MTPKFSSKVREYAESLSIAFILAMVIKCFVVEAFKIPTGSMEPTLRGDPSEGDRILVSKLYYSAHDPERWDIFVFYYPAPSEKQKHYIKRLVGRPGETIRIYNGNLYVNGRIAGKPADIQEAMWRKLADERMLAAAELLHTVNSAKAARTRALRNKFPGAPWAAAAAAEYEQQLRLLENGVPVEYIYKKSAKRARSALSKRWRARMTAAGSGLPPEQSARDSGQFERWLGLWLRQRREAEPKILDLNREWIAKQRVLLQKAMQKAWRTSGFQVSTSGRLEADSDGATATYHRKIVDGRFSDHIEFITDDGTVWRDRKIGSIRGRGGNDTQEVGDIKFEADVFVPAQPGAYSAIVTKGSGIEFVLRVGVTEPADLDDGIEFAFVLTRNGKEVGESTQVIRTGPALELHLEITNVDGVYTAKAGDSVVLQDDYTALEASENEPSSIQLLASKGVTFDNIGIWRDVYYTKMGKRMLDDVREWGRDGVFTLGEGEYLALGDNSPNSRDSRDWGPVPAENIVGRAFFILLPFRRLDFLK